MKAIIFDMDGLLIDSEPLWHEAEKAVFATIGLQLSTEDCLRTTGLRVDAVVKYWNAPPALAEQIIQKVIALIEEKGTAKPGAHAAIEACRHYPLAIASSSALRIIAAVEKRLNLGFQVIHSAENEAQGKPHPAVYLSTARKLGLSPTDCVAIEDSQAGIHSAKAAGMRCIAVPDVLAVTGADLVLPSLLALDGKLLAELATKW